MDVALASVIVAGLFAVSVAIIKYVPKKTNGNGNGYDKLYAKREEYAALRARVISLEHYVYGKKRKYEDTDIQSDE